MRQLLLILAAFLGGGLVTLGSIAGYMHVHPNVVAAQPSPSPGVNSGEMMPPCPHLTYGANGSVGGAFCVVANPTAVHYFLSEGSKTIALGPDATPDEVASAMMSDFGKIGGLPVLCEVYQISAWRNGWNLNSAVKQTFLDGIGQQLHAYDNWCSEPHFSV